MNPDNKKPFVYLNPESFLKISQNDQIYVLSNKLPKNCRFCVSPQSTWQNRAK